MALLLLASSIVVESQHRSRAEAVHDDDDDDESHEMADEYGECPENQTMRAGREYSCSSSGLFSFPTLPDQDESRCRCNSGYCRKGWSYYNLAKKPCVKTKKILVFWSRRHCTTFWPDEWPSTTPDPLEQPDADPCKCDGNNCKELHVG